MRIEFAETTNNGVGVKYTHTSLSSLSLAELRENIDYLNTESDTSGCAVFEGESPDLADLIIFAGNLERFSMLSAARFVRSRVFYFQDTHSWWYGGSSVLPDIVGISSFLREHVTGRRSVIFGQSSGGYAALAVGSMIEDCDVIACSPQTFPDREIKSKIETSQSLAVQCTPDYLLDIRKQYDDCERSGFAAAIFSASEYENPYQSHFWMDHLHLANICRTPGIETFIAAAASHSLVFRRAGAFSECLQEVLASAHAGVDVKRGIVKDLISKISYEETSLP